MTKEIEIPCEVGFEYIEFQRKITFTCECGEKIEELGWRHTVNSPEEVTDKWDGDSVMCDKCGRWYDIYDDCARFVGVDSAYIEDDAWKRYED